MEENFEYCLTKRFENDITISDIGNCVIRANPDVPKFTYLWIKTELGSTRILQVGPVLLDDALQFDQLTYCRDSFGCTFNSLGYDERKIGKIIDTFLNKNGFTQAIEMTEEQFREEVPNIDVFKFMEK